MYGAWIKAARLRAGVTVQEAARRAGYSTPHMLYRIEKDERTASLEALDGLASAYGMRVGDLLPNSGASPVGDRFEPLTAALFGLPADEVDEIVRYLAEIARITRAWRDRQVSTAPDVAADAQG